jgi:hypothetical protein
MEPRVPFSGKTGDDRHPYDQKRGVYRQMKPEERRVAVRNRSQIYNALDQEHGNEPGGGSAPHRPSMP